MSRNRIVRAKATFAVLSSLALMIGTCACDSGRQSHATAQHQVSPPAEKTDPPLADFQSRLLNLAFETASRIPLKPHIKDRSRAQEAVVAACLRLQQPRKALAYAEQIANWRRGTAYADVALYYAQHNQREESQSALRLAESVAEHGIPGVHHMEEEAQPWRRDLVKAKVAQAYAWLEQPEQAQAIEAELPPAYAGKLAQTRAALANDQAVDELIRALDAVTASGEMDVVSNALAAWNELHRRYYRDTLRRPLIEARIARLGEGLPPFARVEMLCRLAQHALELADPENALALVDEADRLLARHQWSLEDEIPLAAPLISLRSRAGDGRKATEKAGALLNRYRRQREEITDIWRAAALRPLAEAYQTLGDSESAHAVYALAVEEGGANPNARPRAEDLSATCVSMAVSGVAPDTTLWARMTGVYSQLGDPW